MDPILLSNLRRTMSAAKTQTNPACLGDAILSTQFAVSPPGVMHPEVDVAAKMNFFKRSRFTDRECIEILFRFLKDAGMTAEQCNNMAQILMDKYCFKLKKPVDFDTLAVLETAEFESFQAAEAQLAATQELGRAFDQLQSILMAINSD
jgi:hypothetical protein